MYNEWLTSLTHNLLFGHHLAEKNHPERAMTYVWMVLLCFMPLLSIYEQKTGSQETLKHLVQTPDCPKCT